MIVHLSLNFAPKIASLLRWVKSKCNLCKEKAAKIEAESEQSNDNGGLDGPRVSKRRRKKRRKDKLEEVTRDLGQVDEVRVDS
jgi:hypothetical protein